MKETFTAEDFLEMADLLRSCTRDDVIEMVFAKKDMAADNLTIMSRRPDHPRYQATMRLMYLMTKVARDRREYCKFHGITIEQLQEMQSKE